MRSRDFLRCMVLELAFSSMAACGGVSVGNERPSSMDATVPGADVGNAVEPAGTAQPAGNAGGQDIVVINGWTWNVACPRSIDALCANGGVAGAPCVSNWSNASNPASWCEDPSITQVALWPPCKGRRVVSLFGSPPSFGADELFVFYFYDETSGELLHVDSDAVPSVSTCVAGVSGSRYDVFGCDPPPITDCR